MLDVGEGDIEAAKVGEEGNKGGGGGVCYGELPEFEVVEGGEGCNIWSGEAGQEFLEGAVGL